MKIAIYGYDTIVGKQVLEELDNSNLPIEEFYPLSPIAMEYEAVPLRGKNHVISCVDEFDFAQAQVAIFLTTKDESERLIPEVQAAGCTVIDNSHLYSSIDQQPIVLKQINPYNIVKVLEKKLAVVPSAISTEIVLSTMPAHDEWGVRKAVVTALVSASEHGDLGTQTLARETSQLLNGMGVDVTDFPAQIAFNIHTRIGQIDDQGLSDYESVVNHEVFSLMDRFEQGLSLTCIQVPVFYGHTLSVHLELEDDPSLEDFLAVYGNCDHVQFEDQVKPELDADEEEAAAAAGADGAVDSTKQVLVTPVSCAELENKIFISRVRKTDRGCFDFTVVMDNTRLGEAATIVNVLDLLRQHMV